MTLSRKNLLLRSILAARTQFFLGCFLIYFSCYNAQSAELKPIHLTPPPTTAAVPATTSSNAQSTSTLEETPQPTEVNTEKKGAVIEKSQPRTPKIALLLPSTGKLSGVGQLVLDGFLAARNQDQQADTLPEIKFYNTDTDSIATVYQTAVTEGATIVVGPIEKEKVAELKATHIFPVPILALNYATTTVATPSKTSNTESSPAIQSLINKPRDQGSFYQFGLAAEDEAEQIADQALLDGHQSAAVIYPDNEWGKRISQSFIQRWRQQGGTITTKLAFSTPEKIAPDIKRMLALKPLSPIAGAKARMRHRDDIDFIVLLATPDQGRQIKPILNFYYADDIPVYATSHIYGGSPNPRQDKDLDDIFFIDEPWILEAEDPMNAVAEENWPHQSGQAARLRGLGIDAYRLQDQLASMTSLAHITIQGTTGQLTAEKSHKIRRRLTWAKMNNGIPEVISSASDEPAPLNQQNHSTQ